MDILYMTPKSAVTHELNTTDLEGPCFLVSVISLIFTLFVPFFQFDGVNPFGIECSNISHYTHNVSLWVSVFFLSVIGRSFSDDD